MWKYEMGPTSIVEDTERTRFCPQTDRRKDEQTDKVKPVYPHSTSLSEGFYNRALTGLTFSPDWAVGAGKASELIELERLVGWFRRSLK